MLTVVTFLWGDKYDLDDVAKLHRGVTRHLEQHHRFVLLTDRTCEIVGASVYAIPPEDQNLLRAKGCFARLRLFDPVLQTMIQAGERIVSMDLDSVVTGSLDVLFNRPEPFVVLQGANAANPCPYNGSLWMLRAGHRPDVWGSFNLEAASLPPHYEFPDDQGWLWHKLPGAAAWHVGPRSGVYAFKKPQWPKGDDLPRDARLVVFPGWRSPEKFKHLPWVAHHWMAA